MMCGYVMSMAILKVLGSLSFGKVWQGEETPLGDKIRKPKKKFPVFAPTMSVHHKQIV